MKLNKRKKLLRRLEEVKDELELARVLGVKPQAWKPRVKELPEKEVTGLLTRLLDVSVGKLNQGETQEALSTEDATPGTRERAAQVKRMARLLRLKEIR